MELMRAKTLKLDDFAEKESSPKPPPLSRAKSHANLPQQQEAANQPQHQDPKESNDGVEPDVAVAEAVAPVGTGDAKEEEKGKDLEETEKEPAENHTVEDVPDLPMVTREDQRELKGLKDLGGSKGSDDEGEGGEVKKKPSGKGKAKAKAKAGAKSKAKAKAKGKAQAKAKNKMKRPAASTKRTQKQKSKEQEEPEEEEDHDEEAEEEEAEMDEDEAAGTQHYSPAESPLEPQNLDGKFEDVSDKPAASNPTENPPDTKSRKRKADPKPKAPSKRSKSDKAAETGSSSRGTKRDSGGDDKAEGVDVGEGENGEGIMAFKKSFAGRFPPKREIPKQRFDVMVATFEDKINPAITHKRSEVEVGMVFVSFWFSLQPKLFKTFGNMILKYTLS